MRSLMKYSPVLWLGLNILCQCLGLVFVSFIYTALNNVLKVSVSHCWWLMYIINHCSNIVHFDVCFYFLYMFRGDFSVNMTTL